MKVLLLTTDAYGGHGGIALYNRDLADAVASLPEVEKLVVVPRTMPFAPGPIPDKVKFVSRAAGGKLRYVLAASAAALEGFDLVICGHINLLSLAHALNAKLRAPMVLLGYGIDVWSPPSDWVRRRVASLDAVWVISAITRDRMNDWAQLPLDRYVLMPNAIHLERYGEGAPSAEIVERHQLQGRKVLMTLARLPSFERYKGIDEVLEVLPGLLKREPRLAYVVAGEGDDRPRLERKSNRLGLKDKVIFTGLLAESEKADYFRLADAFVMPGRGEGFGFVFLEALACGVPAVGSQVDGSREALRDGELGELVDPADPGSVSEGILRALSKPKGIPEGLGYFAWPRFRERVASALQSLDLGPARKT